MPTSSHPPMRTSNRTHGCAFNGMRWLYCHRSRRLNRTICLPDHDSNFQLNGEQRWLFYAMTWGGVSAGAKIPI